MTTSPCKNCSNRKIPKTCEKNCELWIAFKEKHKKEKEMYILNKQTEHFCYGKYDSNIRR